MLFRNKKKDQISILTKMHPDGSTSEMKKAEEGNEHNEYTSCAEDIISAVQSGSIQKMASALKAFHELVKEEDLEQDAKE